MILVAFIISIKYFSIYYTVNKYEIKPKFKTQISFWNCKQMIFEFNFSTFENEISKIKYCYPVLKNCGNSLLNPTLNAVWNIFTFRHILLLLHF